METVIAGRVGNQIGLFRETSDVPETIIIDRVIEATTLADVTPPRTDEKKP